MRDVIESVQLPAELQSQAARFAEMEGVSLEQWVLEAIANKVKTAAFFHDHSQRASGRSLGEILESVPDNPPMPGDELPEGWRL